MKQFVYIALFLLWATSSYGQKMTVESFDYLPNDLVARTEPRFDLNDKTCAVIRVGIALQGVVFDGNTIGSPKYNTGEYLVYITNGSRQLTIRHEHFLPLTVTFADYGTERVESGNVYRLTVIVPNNEKSSKQYVDAIVPFKVDSVTFNMVRVDGGSFIMGATPEQKSPKDDEKPSHKVTLSSYYMGETEVTQELWKTVMGYNPSYWVNPNFPVINVSWNDCRNFIRRLNEKTGGKFRLPTEAEWEYAARGGNRGQGYQYSGGNDAKDVAVYYVEPKTKKEKLAAWHGVGSILEVAEKKENELGIYDMSGNVWEMCSDWQGEYSESKETNPSGPKEGTYRAIRGGSWKCAEGMCRVAMRNGVMQDRGTDDLGFRLAFSVDENNAPETYYNDPLPLVGSLKVVSQVDDADVYVDSVYVGKVNRLFPKTTVGVHLITVKKDGFKDFSEKVLVKENQQTDLQAVLYRMCEAKTVSLAISDDEEPMVGASMNHYREGTRINMTISDIDGFIHNCKITNGDVIIISYVGYKVKEIIIKDVNAVDGTLSVKLTKGSNKRKETIIIGE